MLLGTVNAELKMEPENANLRYNETQLVEELNDEFREKILPVTIFVGVEVFLGFFGNLLVLYVFSFHYHVCNFRYFVLCLALTDLTSTLTTMPGEMVTHMYWYIYPVKEICKVKSFFNMFTVVAEALCLLTIAVDRYRKVCRPFGWQIQPKCAQIVIIFIYVISLILAMPVPFLWGISHHQEEYKGVNITTTICEKDGKYKLTKRPLQYSITMESALSMCLLVMLVLYVQVARTLLKKKRRKRWSARFNSLIPSSSFQDSSSQALQMNIDQGHSEIAFISSPENSPRKNSHQIGHPSPDEPYVFSFKPSENLFVEEHHEKDNESGEQRSQVTPEAQVLTTFKSNDQHKPGHIPLIARQINVTGNSFDRDLPTDESRGITSDEDAITKHKSKQTRDVAEHRIPRKSVRSKVRRKTLIMFVLTITFMITTVLYLTLLSFIARSDDVLHKMSHTWKAIYFLAFRLYFINHVINPIVYGLLDPHFRKGLQKRK